MRILISLVMGVSLSLTIKGAPEAVFRAEVSSARIEVVSFTTQDGVSTVYYL